MTQLSPCVLFALLFVFMTVLRQYICVYFYYCYVYIYNFFSRVVYRIVYYFGRHLYGNIIHNEKLSPKVEKYIYMYTYMKLHIECAAVHIWCIESVWNEYRYLRVYKSKIELSRKPYFSFMRCGKKKKNDKHKLRQHVEFVCIRVSMCIVYIIY